MGNDEVVDLMIYDGLWDIFNNYHMGVTAEKRSRKYRHHAGKNRMNSRQSARIRQKQRSRQVCSRMRSFQW